ncbi:MAG: ATP-binding protein [Gallionella sp.]|nr:ATP-binding protein [Gallionella sp.]
MSKKRSKLDALRMEAEAQVAGMPLAESALPAKKLLHELSVHQIELEMQNDELRRAQVFIEESRDRYMDLYDFAPTGYLTLNREALIIEMNFTGAGMLGVERKSMPICRFPQFVAAEDCDRWHRHFISVLQHAGRQSCELVFQRGDGSRLHAQLDCLHMEVGGTFSVRIALSDITARKQAEAERALLYQTLQEKNAELEHAKFVAEKASLAKSTFLSRMSHELRTPLNAILGFAQLLEASSPPPTAIQTGRLQQINKAGWYLLELINEILDLAVIESGKLPLSQEPVLLANVMFECQAMIEFQAQQRGVKLSFLPFDNTWFANADRTRIKQVLINLLSNAIQYNHEQGTVEVECIACTTERIRISIKDSGAGLPPEKLAQLFQPFNRLGQENGIEEGTGIGLAVTKQLVELMGGTIGVESTVGVGSEFWIELNRDVTSQPAARNAMPTEFALQAQGNAKRSAARRNQLYV